MNKTNLKKEILLIILKNHEEYKKEGLSAKVFWRDVIHEIISTLDNIVWISCGNNKQKAMELIEFIGESLKSLVCERLEKGK
jgi:hypothetical protein